MTRLTKTLAADVWNLINTLPILGILLLMLMAPCVRAQSPTDNGTPLGLAPGSPEGTYALSGFENVNLYSGGLSFSLPLLQIGGRGSEGYSVQLLVQSHWIVQKNEWYDENENTTYRWASVSIVFTAPAGTET
jgi:hypothetical protein